MKLLTHRLSLEMEILFHPTLYDACNCLFVLEVNLTRVSKSRARVSAITIISVMTVEQISLTNPIMHQLHISQCTIQDRNVHNSVLYGALWEMGEMYCGTCEVGLLTTSVSKLDHHREMIACPLLGAKPLFEPMLVYC